MWRLAHLRTYVARHPLIYWAVVAMLAAIAAHLVVARFDAAEAARREWAETVEVLVATGDHRPGEVLVATSIELPAAAVPADAIDELPVGSRARQFLSAGSVLERADVATVDGPAAGAAAGTAVVPVPMPTPTGGAVGVRVDVLADGIVLAADAMVVASDGDTLFVAVARREAPAVAAATLTGLAGVVFLP